MQERRCAEGRSGHSLGPFVEAYVGSRANLKPNTLRNYLQVTDEHFETAVQSGAKSGASDAPKERNGVQQRMARPPTKRKKPLKTQGFRKTVQYRAIPCRKK